MKKELKQEVINLKNNSKMRIIKNSKGITLIALVITIIVLLILASVSIAMLTGENGILNQANKAKTETEYKGAEEKVKLAIMGARADDGQMTVAELEREIGYQGGTLTGDAFPVEVTVDGHTFTVEDSGKVTGNESGGSTPTPEGQGTLGTVTGNEETNTTVKDKLGNEVKVPAGFKVVNPTETVPDGIIIEDVSHEATKGSQFVWIPVGEVTKKDKTKVTINLSRYTFADNGQETDQGDKAISTNYQELATSTYGNTTAKNLEEFKTKASKGYYIGRYEARDKDATTARTDSTNDTNQLVCTADNYVYNYVTQPQAAELSRNMYSDSNFESDLMNSYAWDTAIIFLQKFDNRENKTETTKPYSRQNSLNTTLATQGTNKLSTQDKICNIFDLASNTFEWTTEAYSDAGIPCVSRGGVYNYSSYYTSNRPIFFTSNSYGYHAFRPLLYL